MELGVGDGVLGELAGEDEADGGRAGGGSHGEDLPPGRGGGRRGGAAMAYHRGEGQ